MEESKKYTCMECGFTFIPSVIFDFYQEGSDPEVGRCENCLMKSNFGTRETVIHSEPLSPPTGYRESVCRFGEGRHTCSFLGFANDSSVSCLKHSSFDGGIRRRIMDGTMTAQGDNCSGPPSFKV